MGDHGGPGVLAPFGEEAEVSFEAYPRFDPWLLCGASDYSLEPNMISSHDGTEARLLRLRRVLAGLVFGVGSVGCSGIAAVSFGGSGVGAGRVLRGLRRCLRETGAGGTGATGLSGGSGSGLAADALCVRDHSGSSRGVTGVCRPV